MDIISFFASIVAGVPIKIKPADRKKILTFSKTLEYEPMSKDIITNEYIPNQTKGEISKLLKVIDTPKINFVRNPTENALNHFCKQTMAWETKTIIVNSWFNRIKPGRDSEILSHQNSLLTGILFFNIQKDGPSLVFEKEGCSFEPTVSFLNQFNMRKAAVLPKQDYLVLFNSSLRFKFSLNRSKKVHHNLMFTTMPVGPLGEKTTALGLNANK
tara:strand:- start:126 stop:767 length:642 start_codon:yes stop_codon:yes gene_type:complete